MRREKLWLIGKIGLSAGLITYFFQRVDIAQMINCLSTYHLGWLWWAIVVSFLAYAVNTYKWQILLKALKVRVAFKRLFFLNLIGIFYSLFVPGGQISGEFIKAAKLIKINKRGSKVIVSIAMDRLTGILALVVLALVGIAIQHNLIKNYHLLMWILAILSVIILFILVILNKELSSLAERTGQSLLNRERLRFLRRYVLPLWNCFVAYRENISSIGQAIGYSFVYQLLVIAVCYLVALSLDIQISFAVLLWVASIVFIVQTLPISVSGIGVREGTFIFLLAQYGVSTLQALTLSLTIFAIMVITGLVGGAIEMKDYWSAWRKRD